MNDGQDMLRQLLRRNDERNRADAARYQALDWDECQLCGAEGEDKRSLWIDCFYAIEEAVPEAIRLAAVDVAGVRATGYLLRMCKSCRADLLASLAEWRRRRVALRGTPKDHDGRPELPHDPERNIPVRIHGAIQMLTLAEWDERVRAGREERGEER